MPRITEAQVVRELRGADRNGCRHLVDLFQALLTGEGTNVFHIPLEDAEELVSDTLLAVVKNISKFQFRKGEGDFHCWVSAIFRNKVRDFIRRKASEGGFLLQFEESALENESEYTKTEHQVVVAIVRAYEDAIRSAAVEKVCPGCDEGAAKLRVIEETLEKMEAWERVLLRCRALDISFEEIAEYTGKPVAQLKVYHGRVKKKFVQLLARHYPELNKQ